MTRESIDSSPGLHRLNAAIVLSIYVSPMKVYCCAKFSICVPKAAYVP